MLCVRLNIRSFQPLQQIDFDVWRRMERSRGILREGRKSGQIERVRPGNYRQSMPDKLFPTFQQKSKFSSSRNHATSHFSALPLSPEQALLSRHLLARLLQHRKVEETRKRRSQLGRRRTGEGEEKRVEEWWRRRRNEEEERRRRRIWESERRRREDQDPSPSIVYPQVSHQVMYQLCHPPIVSIVSPTDKTDYQTIHSLSKLEANQINNTLT